jgi:hypothetical protein
MPEQGFLQRGIAMRRLILISLAALLMALVMPVSAAWAQPVRDVALGPDPVRAGEELTITGEGFDPGSTVTITWCFDGVAATPVVDEVGDFAVRVRVPLDAPAGPTCIDVEGAGQYNFTILPAATAPTPQQPGQPPVNLGPLEPGTDPALFGFLLARCLQEQTRSPNTLGPACGSLLAQGLGVLIRFIDPLPAE